MDGSSESGEVRLFREQREQVARRLQGRAVVLFLDFDGTLTPIVARPDLAVLDPNMRDRVRRIAQTCPVAIVSGRDLDDITKRVGIDGLIYAGSHGFDMRGPDFHMTPDGIPADMPERMRAVGGEIERNLAAIAGVVVEIKRFAVSVHFRLVAPDRVGEVEAAVWRAVDGALGLRVTGGKMLFEIRPDMSWDKGAAALWLLHRLYRRHDMAMPIFVGDDATDEDAFRAVRGRGIGVLCAEAARPTAADYRLVDIGEVGEFLDWLRETLLRPGSNSLELE